MQRQSPTEDVIAQKQVGEPGYVGAYNVGKYNGGVPSVVRPWSLGNCDTLKACKASIPIMPTHLDLGTGL